MWRVSSVFPFIVPFIEIFKIPLRSTLKTNSTNASSTFAGGMFDAITFSIKSLSVDRNCSRWNMKPSISVSLSMKTENTWLFLAGIGVLRGMYSTKVWAGVCVPSEFEEKSRTKTENSLPACWRDMKRRKRHRMRQVRLYFHKCFLLILLTDRKVIKNLFTYFWFQIKCLQKR